MNKQELIASIAEKANLSQGDAGAAVAAITASITDALKAGEKVALLGFGTFEVRIRAARQGKNPATGETIDIPEKKLPVFKAGKALKDAVD